MKTGLRVKILSLLCLGGVVMLSMNGVKRQTSKETNANSLSVTVANIRNAEGLIRLTLFNQEQNEAFPGDGQKAYKVLSVSARKESVDVTFSNLPKGKYAIAILHDENENGELDTNMVGYPKEGYGASNNELPVFRAPTFSEAAFDLVEAKQALTIRLRY